jgi:hypothetical protein
MPETPWLQQTTAAFRLMIATSWRAPDAWREKQEAAIREAIAAGPDWAEYLRLVDRHRVPALSCATLKRVSSLAIPKPVQQELQKRGNACRMQAVRHCLQLAEILKAFNRAGIPVMSLKGPLLSFELYGDVGLRQSKDLDLMVPLQDFSRARSCMESADWQLEHFYLPLTPRKMEFFSRHVHHLGFVRSQTGGCLELHWRAPSDTPEQADARWGRSTTVEWQGAFLQAMHPIDELLCLCNHGGAHAWSRAKWLGDLARIHAQGEMNWAEALDEAREFGEEKVLLASLRLLQEVYALPLPALPENSWNTLPAFLIKAPLYALREQKEAGARNPLVSVWNEVQSIRYGRLVLPHRRWRDILAELFYTPADFQMIHLPDRFFWAYAALRPFLWIWRRVLRREPAAN